MKKLLIICMGLVVCLSAVYPLLADETLEIYQKTGDYSAPLPDGASGTLTYEPVWPTFDYTFSASGLDPGIEYHLIYYPDGWPGNGLIVLGTGEADAQGFLDLSSTNTLDIGDLPKPFDANYPTGAKIWLVPTDDVVLPAAYMTNWVNPHPVEWLFEDHLITYDDLEDGITGTVTRPGNVPQPGVTIALYDEFDDLLESTVTDANGVFLFDELLPGIYDVDCILPLGFEFVAPSVHLIPDVVVPQVQNVDWVMEPTEIYHQARSAGFWKHLVKARIAESNANLDHTQEELITFGEEIFGHYHGYMPGVPVDPIQVEGVTYVPNGSFEPIALNLQDMEETLSMNGSSMWGKACRQYLALLLNVVSGRVPQYIQFTQDGLYVTQVVYYINQLLANTTNTDSLEKAKDIAETMNHGEEIAAGVIPPDTPFYLYSYEDIVTVGINLPTSDLRFPAPSPNPFNPATTLSFQLPEAGQVTLSVFDVSGRKVAQLVDGWLDAGSHQTVFDGSGLASGIYLARIEAGNYSALQKVVLLK